MDLAHIRKLAGVLEEGKKKAKEEYDDSAEFTDELADVGAAIEKVAAILEQKRWTDWMKITDQNYSTGCVDANRRMITKFKELKNLYEQLEGMLMDAE